MQRVQQVLQSRLGASDIVMNVEHIYSTNKTKVVFRTGASVTTGAEKLVDAIRHTESICNTKISVAYAGQHDVYC